MSELAFDTNLCDADLIPSEGGPPYGLFDAWREKDPVHWNPPPENYDTYLMGSSLTQGFWVLTRYKDVFDVSRDTQLFSSWVGGPVIWDLEPEMLESQRAGLMGKDEPQHSKLKRLVMPPFSPKELAKFEPEVARAAKEIIDAVADKGECEFVFDIASRLPVYTFCVLMGIPEEMRERVFTLGNMTADVESRQPGEENPQSLLFEIAQQLSEEKRKNPDDSMLSRYIHGEVEGEKLTQDQVNTFFVTMSIAGHETTRGTAAQFARLMLEYPDQYELIKSDPDKYLPNAISEVLRFAPPVIKFRRTATEDTEIGGQKISKGDKIYLSYPAANRDPSVFENPNEFDITRPNAGKHLAFGTGPHVCLGARLAQMQLKLLLKEMVTRIPDFRFKEQPKMLRSIWFNALINMPIEFTPEQK